MPPSRMLFQPQARKRSQGSTDQSATKGRSMNSTGATKPSSTGRAHTAQASAARPPHRRTGVASAYGAAGSLAAILVWIYWSAQIFLYGACVLRVQQPDAGGLNSAAIPASEAGHAPTTTRNGEHP